MTGMTRGWWNMACWNGLSEAQQRRLIEHGNLPIDYRPEGECENPATLCIETQDDEAEGPRFYCWECGADYVKNKRPWVDPMQPGHFCNGSFALVTEETEQIAPGWVRCRLCGESVHPSGGRIPEHKVPEAVTS